MALMLRPGSHLRVSFLAAAPLLAAACASVEQAPVAAAPEPAPPAFNLSDVLGAASREVDALLGPPALVRREGNGEYRRYSLKECALIVILYPDETGAAKAAHVDAAALTSDEEKPDPAKCLAAG